MTNQRIAITFERVADLLEQQGASAHRVRVCGEDQVAALLHRAQLC